jgi:RNA polymerase sigma-70 factor (ECF subfamily)
MASQPLVHDPPGPRLRLVADGEPSAAPTVQPRPSGQPPASGEPPASGSPPASGRPPASGPPPAQPPSAQDEELVEAFQAGDAGAGARLYDRLFPVVDATIVRILGRREHDHADLVQSTFEQIVSTLSRRTFARHCSLAGWAAVLACHVGLNALRSRRRERGVIDRGQEIGAQGTVEKGAPASLESQLRARDELAWVRRHLAEMDPDRVTTLLLNAMGHELVEIAGLTGTSVAAAQSRLSRARRELRARLEEVHSARVSASAEHDDPRHS